MSPFTYNTLTNVHQSPHSVPGIAGLLIEILVLQERLNETGKQSEYFLWGIPQHRDHLSVLLQRYDLIREEFNRYSIAHFRQEITAQELNMLTHANLTPKIARCMMMARSRRIIQEMNDMIAVKNIMDKLPVFEEVKLKDELLKALLKVSAP